MFKPSMDIENPMVLHDPDEDWEDEEEKKFLEEREEWKADRDREREMLWGI